ncbi:MAG TPA: hypothetical protein VGL33_07625 [Streptosporangiaceae bacterium]
MDADQLDLKITGHVITPGRVLEDGWIGVRGEIVAGLGPAAPTARQIMRTAPRWRSAAMRWPARPRSSRPWSGCGWTARAWGRSAD